MYEEGVRAMHILDTLKERGFIAQVTFEEELYKQLEKESTTFYVGFDPTAPSLHFGHFIPIMAMRHMQLAGHRPIALVGGGTAMVGDPSGKTDMRRMMTVETVEQNALTIKRQLSRFLDFSAGKAMMVNNADWLLNLNYLEFIRDIGAHFSVNRMLAADCYKQRYESGLTFLEFNYMPMQSYDFLMLFKKHNCRLQMGGDDQWSNMLSGADLIRRKEREAAFACTFKLLLNSEGVKMGKTEKGALWLDSDMCSPYDFYQYWRNVSDSDVEKCLGLLTFLPMDEVRRLSALEGSQINEAKKVLAFECTALVHGKEEAQKAQLASAALFDNTGESLEDVPTFVVTDQILEEDNRLTSLLHLCGLCASRTEARKMVGQGAVQVDGDKATDVEMRILRDALDKTDGLLLRKGKKSYCRLILQ
jgi:tyrosyl-tRNA synthetase